MIQWKLTLLDRSYARFMKSTAKVIKQEFQDFSEAESFWLDDFALFMAIKEANGGGAWSDWPEPLRLRDAETLANFKTQQADSIQRHKFRQFLFFQQWGKLRQFANEKGITIIGDVPIFVAYDSADAWANPDLFFFDKKGLPTVVAGVPPDYFSPTGQLWGNPLYRWEEHHQHRLCLVDPAHALSLEIIRYHPSGSFPRFCRLLGSALLANPPPKSGVGLPVPACISSMRSKKPWEICRSLPRISVKSPPM